MLHSSTCVSVKASLCQVGQGNRFGTLRKFCLRFYVLYRICKAWSLFCEWVARKPVARHLCLKLQRLKLHHQIASMPISNVEYLTDRTYIALTLMQYRRLCAHLRRYRSWLNLQVQGPLLPLFVWECTHLESWDTSPRLLHLHYCLAKSNPSAWLAREYCLQVRECLFSRRGKVPHYGQKCKLGQRLIKISARVSFQLLIVVSILKVCKLSHRPHDHRHLPPHSGHFRWHPHFFRFTPPLLLLPPALYLLHHLY